MQTAYILTGYNDLTLSLANSSTTTEAYDLSLLIDKYVDHTQCTYDTTGIDPEDPICPPMGLNNSRLLCQLPWFTPCSSLFETKDPIKVF
jgi:hypothetical protein